MDEHSKEWTELYCSNLSRAVLSFKPPKRIQGLTFIDRRYYLNRPKEASPFRTRVAALIPLLTPSNTGELPDFWFDPSQKELTFVQWISNNNSAGFFVLPTDIETIVNSFDEADLEKLIATLRYSHSERVIPSKYYK